METRFALRNNLNKLLPFVLLISSLTWFHNSSGMVTVHAQDQTPTGPVYIVQ